MAEFRVALSGDFFKEDGSPSFAEFDLSPLRDRDDVELIVLDPGAEIGPEQVAEVDALILLAPKLTARSLTPGGRLAMVARFGVGYDNVDVDACTANGVMLVITPDGVRRPVAVSILTLMFALTGKLMVKAGLGRRGPAGWAEKSGHNGVGLIGRTLGSLGVGNIGAELFRLAKPLAKWEGFGPCIKSVTSICTSAFPKYGNFRNRIRLYHRSSYQNVSL